MPEDEDVQEEASSSKTPLVKKKGKANPPPPGDKKKKKKKGTNLPSSEQDDEDGHEEEDDSSRKDRVTIDLTGDVSIFVSAVASRSCPYLLIQFSGLGRACHQEFGGSQSRYLSLTVFVFIPIDTIP